MWIAESVIDKFQDNEWGRILYKKATEKSNDIDDYLRLADSVICKLHDKVLATTLYNKAQEKAEDQNEEVKRLADGIRMKLNDDK